MKKTWGGGGEEQNKQTLKACFGNLEKEKISFFFKKKCENEEEIKLVEIVLSEEFLIIPP